MEITPHIHAIKIPFTIPVVPGKTIERFVYSYLVLGSHVCLIDSGVAGSEQMIYDCLQQQGLDPGSIDMLLLTHAHPDHIGAAAAIKERTGCTVAAHPGSRAWVEDVEVQFKERPVPGFHSLVGGSVSVDRLLDDQEVIDLGDLSLQILYTPGHSMDSLSLFCPEGGVLFAGDTIPQQNDLPIYEDAKTLAQSISKLGKIEGIIHLLSSWSDLQRGGEAYTMMDEGLAYINNIHQAVRQFDDKEILNNPIQLCRQLVEQLGLPAVAVNPIVAQSFSSHVRVVGQRQLP